MAIPGITYRIEKGTSLTHLEMDNNFRSVIYSSSVQNGGDTLWLHFDTGVATDYHTIPLNGGTGGLTINGNVSNRIVTATGTAGLLQGESNFTYDSITQVLTIGGTGARVSLDDGSNNIFIGQEAGDSISGAGINVGIGYQSSKNLTGNYNTSLGNNSLQNALAASSTVALGFSALNSLTSGNNNVALGSQAGINLTSGVSNVYLGNAAGPASSTGQSNKLYINNATSDTPLILGDFSTQQIEFAGGVTGSSFTGSFVGDGSGLTGITVSAEWDGTIEGDVQITGSLVVSGSSVTVDLTNVTSISGSIFSGSFIGDGSGLTGVQADTFPYTGSAIISGSLSVVGPSNVTGSFTVSGSNPIILLKGDTTIDENIKIYNKATTTLSIGALNYANSTSAPINSVAIGYDAGRCTNSSCHVAIGVQAGINAGNSTVAIGYKAAAAYRGAYSTIIGSQTGYAFSGTGAYNTTVGYGATQYLCNGTGNTALGTFSLRLARANSFNTAVGYGSLCRLYSNSSISEGCKNTAIGLNAGRNVANGANNIYIGAESGPSIVNTVESNKLYIGVTAGAPLIYGDFSTNQVEFAGGVTGSSFTGSFVGDGSALTGVEWDGTHNGNANITGSFTVSGSSVVVDFTNTLAISGSTFSGSFVGDGSGLTGVTSEWDGSRNGNANITGSLIISGALDVVDTITITSTPYPNSPGIELIHFYSGSLSGVIDIQSFTINSTTGYTGLKADYSLTNSGEDEKKIGTLLGAWDQSGNTTINDSHTIATGGITGTSFSITSDGSTATLKLDAASGVYDVNMLITAFKRQV
jgi:hypothetical protein